MKRLAALGVVLFTASAGAQTQPVIEKVVVLPSYGTALIRFQISGGTGQPNISVDYGTTTAVGFRNVPRTTWPLTLPSDAVFQTLPLGALQADTIYYFRPSVAGNSATSNWDCNTATGGITTTVDGATVGCDTATGLGWFRTLPLPATFATPDEVAPADVSSLPLSPPAPTLPPLTVSPGNSEELIAKIKACALNTNGNSAVQEILLPAGSVFKVETTLPVRTGPGMCIIRTADMSKLPPDGVRVSPDFAPFMATLMLPLSSSGQNDFTGVINANNTTEGWYFEGIRFSVEAGRNAPQQVYSITNVNDTGDIITVSPPHNYTAIKPFTVHQITGVEGTWDNPNGPNGTYENYAFAAVDKIRILRPAPLTCSSSPCYKSGGTIRLAVESGVCGATNESPVVITTCQEHGFVDNPAAPISNITSAVLSVPAWHGIPNTANEYVVLIENSSVEQWNGQWVVSSTTANTVTIQSGPSVSCTQNCGTVRRLDPVHIKGIEGNTAANGSAYFRVLSPTTFQLLGISGNGEYKAGGVVAQEPVHWRTLFAVGVSTRRIHIDRCLFQPGGWPVRLSIGLHHQGSQSSIINNYIDDVQFFRQIRPVTNRRTILDAFTTNQYYIATSVAIDSSAGDTKLIQNNYIEAHGISIFSQENYTERDPLVNNVLRRNTFYVNDNKRAGSPSSDGLYYPHRHHLEWKRGRRFVMDGNRFIGGWIDYNACGPTIMASPRDGNTITDLMFTNNTIQGGTTALYMLGVDDRANSLTPLVSRIWLDNNIITDMDGYRVANPHDDAVNPAMCGFSLYMNFGVESMHVRHNLFRWARGRRTQTFSLIQGRGAGLSIIDNILWYTNDENEGPLWKSGFNAAASSGTPAPTGAVRNVFDALWSHSKFTNDIVVPSVKNSLDLRVYDSKSSSDTLFRSDCVNYFTGFSNVFCVGQTNGGDSANERTASLGFFNFQANDFRLSADSSIIAGTLTGVDNVTPLAAHSAGDGRPIGPDQDKLDAAQGKVSNVHVTDITNSSAAIAYVAPDADACSIDYSPEPFSSPSTWFIRKSDGGGSDRTRNVDLPNLVTSTTYYYRVLCAADQPAGSFQTR